MSPTPKRAGARFWLSWDQCQCDAVDFSCSFRSPETGPKILIQNQEGVGGQAVQFLIMLDIEPAFELTGLPLADEIRF